MFCNLPLCYYELSEGPLFAVKQLFVTSLKTVVKGPIPNMNERTKGTNALFSA